MEIKTPHCRVTMVSSQVGITTSMGDNEHSQPSTAILTLWCGQGIFLLDGNRNLIPVFTS